jgi:hypothetical protein
MADNSKGDTAEISIAADNETLQQLLDSQYGRLDAGEVRAALEETYTTVWNEDEFNAAFNLVESVPPYVTVMHKENGQLGTLIYVDSPRFYFLFNPEIKNGE